MCGVEIALIHGTGALAEQRVAEHGGHPKDLPEQLSLHGRSL